MCGYLVCGRNSFGIHYWLVSAMAETEFSAETAVFGQKKFVSAKIFECHSVKFGLLIQGTTNFPKFDPQLWNKPE